MTVDLSIRSNREMCGVQENEPILSDMRVICNEVTMGDATTGNDNRYIPNSNLFAEIAEKGARLVENPHS